MIKEVKQSMSSNGTLSLPFMVFVISLSFVGCLYGRNIEHIVLSASTSSFEENDGCLSLHCMMKVLARSCQRHLEGHDNKLS